MIHLKEPIHSGEYLAETLLAVTNEFNITGAVFTCTRDNATANTVMLAEYEKGASNVPVTVQQPWSFTVREGDVRCVAHIINIAVQSALKKLKADPAVNTDSYRFDEGCARLPTLVDSHIEVSAVLAKLRRHIYVFRNRRGWREHLKQQTLISGIKVRQLSLDMPVRWNSTYTMLDTAIKLRVPITALCASQTMDVSMKDIALTTADWQLLEDLREFFLIFVKPATKLQSSVYPSLNMALPLYLKMINKLQVKRDSVGVDTTIRQACTVAYNKLNEYYTITTTQRCTHSTVATICNPWLNL